MFRGSSSTIKRILLVRTDRLGDVILTLPMLPVLRRCFPKAHIAMLLRRYTGEIVEGNPHLDELIWYDGEGGLIPFQEMKRLLRDQRFDAAIICYPTLRLAWLVFRAGIPIRIGTGYRYYSMLFNKRVFEHRKDAKRHEVEYNLNLLRELGCVMEGKPEFFFDIPLDAQKRVAMILHAFGVDPAKELVVIHPGSGGSAREWRPENFGTVARRLAEQRGVRTVVTGLPREADEVSRVVDASGGTAVSMAGMLKVRELAALIQRAQLFIANSTGPLHVAAALNIPVIGLYPQHTPMSARRWGPFTDRKVIFTPQKPLNCGECAGQRREPCACMESITPDEVVRAAVQLLQSAKEPATRA